MNDHYSVLCVPTVWLTVHMTTEKVHKTVLAVSNVLHNPTILECTTE